MSVYTDWTFADNHVTVSFDENFNVTHSTDGGQTWNNGAWNNGAIIDDSAFINITPFADEAIANLGDTVR